jgi:hypothetical protein
MEKANLMIAFFDVMFVRMFVLGTNFPKRTTNLYLTLPELVDV